MKYFKAVITNDFVNSTKRKKFNSTFFVAKYNPTNTQPETNYKMIIDREDGRRVVLELSESEMESFKEQLNGLK